MRVVYPSYGGDASRKVLGGGFAHGMATSRMAFGADLGGGGLCLNHSLDNDNYWAMAAKETAASDNRRWDIICRGRVPEVKMNALSFEKTVGT